MESNLTKLFQSIFGIAGVEQVKEFFRLLDDIKYCQELKENVKDFGNLTINIHKKQERKTALQPEPAHPPEPQILGIAPQPVTAPPPEPTPPPATILSPGSATPLELTSRSKTVTWQESSPGSLQDISWFQGLKDDLSTDLSKLRKGENEAEVFTRCYRKLSDEESLQSELAFHIRCQKISLYQLVEAFAVKRKCAELRRVQRSTCRIIAKLIHPAVGSTETVEHVKETLFQNARAGLRYWEFGQMYGFDELYKGSGSFDDIVTGDSSKCKQQYRNLKHRLDTSNSYRTAKRSKADGEQIQSLEYYALPPIPPSYGLGEFGDTQEGASEEVAANPAGANLSRGNNVYAAIWSDPNDSNLLRGNNLYNVIWPNEPFDDPAQPNLSRGNNLYSTIWPEPSEGFANPAQPNLSRGNNVYNATWPKSSQYFNDPAADMTSDYTNGASVAAAQGII